MQRDSLMTPSQETDAKAIIPLRAAAEHMSKKFTMKAQEVKPERRRLIGYFHVRAAHMKNRLTVDFRLRACQDFTMKPQEVKPKGRRPIG